MIIWKLTLKIVPKQTISVPLGARCLTVQVQGSMPQLWFMCDPSAAKVDREITIVGTGHQLDDDAAVLLSYIGTVQMEEGSLVLHVFEGLL